MPYSNPIKYTKYQREYSKKYRVKNQTTIKNKRKLRHKLKDGQQIKKDD